MTAGAIIAIAFELAIMGLFLFLIHRQNKAAAARLESSKQHPGVAWEDPFVQNATIECWRSGKTVNAVRVEGEPPRFVVELLTVKPGPGTERRAASRTEGLEALRRIKSALKHHAPAYSEAAWLEDAAVIASALELLTQPDAYLKNGQPSTEKNAEKVHASA